MVVTVGGAVVVTVGGPVVVSNGGPVVCVVSMILGVVVVAKRNGLQIQKVHL